jgi:ribonuclease Z
VFITHYHVDHWLGLPGMLKTFDLRGRERPLAVHGPPGLDGVMRLLRPVYGRLKYELDLVELEPAEAVRRDGYSVAAFAVEHRVTAYGYAMWEDERPGRFDADLAERLGVTPGPDFGRLQGDGRRRRARAGPRPDEGRAEDRRVRGHRAVRGAHPGGE